MNALHIINSAPATQAVKSAPQKTGNGNETAAFSKLLEALSGEAPEGNITEEQQNGLIEKLEAAVVGLQELPQEELAAEELEILYALVELLTQQKNEAKGIASSSDTGAAKSSPVTEELQAGKTPLNEKVIVLLKQLSESLQGRATADTKEFEQSTEFTGVEGKKLPLNEEKIEQAIKQLNALAEELGNIQAAKEKPLLTRTAEQLQLHQAIVKAEQEMKLPVSEVQRNVEIKAEAAKPQIAEAPAALQSENGQTLEFSQPEENKPTLTAAPAEAVKSGQAPRTEATAPTPTVRMSNLAEELGEVLRNSLKLTTSAEGTQIKVSIFPEHLGHLEIKLTELNGKIAAQIFTSSFAAKDALDLQVNQLRNTLMQQGIAVDKIEVSQQSSQQSFGQQTAHPEQRFSQQQKQSAASRDKNGYLRMEEETAIERSQLKDGLMKVDYTV